MTNRKSVVAAVGAALVFVMAVSAQTANRTAHLTFSAPVALPGVSLGSGTYVFEIVNPDTMSDVVTVRNKDRSIVYFSGFTELVARPRGQTSPVALGEAQAGMAAPILAWYPGDGSLGHKFIYRAQ